MESCAAIGLSFVINLALVASNANLFFAKRCGEQQAACVPSDFNGDCDVANCSCTVGQVVGFCTTEFSLASESDALRASLHDVAPYVWAVGLLAAGEASTMTCTYAGQVLMGGCIHINLPAWKRVTVTRLIALVPSVLVAIFMCGTDCNTTFYATFNQFLNTWQNIQLPWALCPLLYFGSQKAILGRHRSGMFYLVLTYVLSAFAVGINLYAIQQWFQQYDFLSQWLFVPYGLIWGPMFVLMLFPPKKRGEEPLVPQQ